MVSLERAGSGSVKRVTIAGLLLGCGNNGVVVVINGEVRSVTHRDVQRGPDDWERKARRPSGREQKALLAVSISRMYRQV
jgi:hypothetical protein